MKTLIVIALAALPAFADCTTRTLACPVQTVAGSIAGDDCSASDGSRFDAWTFDGTAGQTISLQLSSASFDTLLVLVDPSKNPMVLNDDASSSTRDSMITYTLPASGTWTVVANTLGASGGGDYVLSLSCPGTGGGGGRRRSSRSQ